MMVILMWKKHHIVFNGNIYYVMNAINKPFKMGIQDYAERMCVMFEMAKIIPTTSRNNKEYHKDAWDTSDMPYKEDMIQKAIKDEITAVIQEEVGEKFGSDYCTISTEEWIDLIGTLEVRDARGSAYFESQNTAYKKNNNYYPANVDASSDSRPRVNASLTLERVNSRLPLATAAPTSIVSSARRKGNPGTATSLNLVSIKIHLIIPRPRRTWMEV